MLLTNTAFKALFTLYPSAENNYTFYFGPSELGARLIDKAG